MQKISYKIFNGKLLLFGEHIINKGAMGLAVPIEQFGGMFKLGDVKRKEIRDSNKLLELFANHIIHNPVLSERYDTNQFLDDIEHGLYFDSNIPQGYGLGSSGALVAAVYHQYRKFKKKNIELSELKNELADLENYYHGKSSGLDALVCYTDKSVLINHGEVTQTFDLKNNSEGAVKIFLLNTYVARSTSPFVHLFLEKCKDPKFMESVKHGLIPATNTAIDSFMQRKYVPLLNSARIISQLQYDMLPEFIPAEFKEVWREGLKHNQYHLKICGAGGGGFIIGFAKADADLHLLLGAKDVRELLVV